MAEQQQVTAAKIIQDVSLGLQFLAKGFSQSQEVPDDLKQRMVGVVEEFNSIIQEISGGGQSQQRTQPVQEPQGGQPVNPAIQA